MSQYFPSYKTYRDVKVDLDLTNYATKNDLENITHIDSSIYALKTNLASLKTEVDKIHDDKLKTVPADLTKLSNIVKNDAVKKTEYYKLVTKVDDIDTRGFVLKTRYENDGAYLEKKIGHVDKKLSDVSKLVKITDLNAKITEVEEKILLV